MLAIPIIAALLLVYWLFMSPFSQIFGRFPYKAKTKDKVVALTFDDGPNEPYTSEIVEFLNDKNIKATFFQVGKCVERYPEITLSMDRAGHVIGNHSLSHAFPKYFTQPGYAQEITDSQVIFKDVLGKTPALFRPPWLWRQPLLFRTLKRLSLVPISGRFCSSFEVFQPSGKFIAARTLAKVRPGSIIIFHDGVDAKGGNRSQTVEAVKITVAELINQEYKFVTINDLLKITAYR